MTGSMIIPRYCVIATAVLCASARPVCQAFMDMMLVYSNRCCDCGSRACSPPPRRSAWRVHRPSACLPAARTRAGIGIRAARPPRRLSPDRQWRLTALARRRGTYGSAGSRFGRGLPWPGGRSPSGPARRPCTCYSSEYGSRYCPPGWASLSWPAWPPAAPSRRALPTAPIRRDRHRGRPAGQRRRPG